jgi:hypothetical protein
LDVKALCSLYATYKGAACGSKQVRQKVLALLNNREWTLTMLLDPRMDAELRKIIFDKMDAELDIGRRRIEVIENLCILHVDMLNWALRNRLICSFNIIKKACEVGNLAVLQAMHEYKRQDGFHGFTPDAMSTAACVGHLHIVKWLHKNRTEGCTMRAMDWAAMNGRLDIVKWLHKHRKEGCTPRAMDWAAMYGRLDVAA